MLVSVERRCAPGTPRARRSLRLGSALAFGVLCAGGAYPGEVDISVRAPGGALVPDVSVVLEPAVPVAAPKRRDHPVARIEQRDRRFIPQLLVIQRGTQVEFPNNDTISHQVYSFSPARRFQLSLYKGTVHPPIAFDTPGLVVLGCNIHDDMIGYVLVTDSPYFGLTDANGSAHIAGVPAGRYTLHVWAPRIADTTASLDRGVEVAESGEATVGVTLAKPLLAAPSPRPGRAEWDAY